MVSVRNLFANLIPSRLPKNTQIASCLKASWDGLGGLLVRLGAVLDDSWPVLGHIGGVVGNLESVLGPPGPPRRTRTQVHSD